MELRETGGGPLLQQEAARMPRELRGLTLDNNPRGYPPTTQPSNFWGLAACWSWVMRCCVILVVLIFLLIAAHVAIAWADSLVEAKFPLKLPHAHRVLVTRTPGERLWSLPSASLTVAAHA